nr:hypothetical protein GCM10020063_011760 [Dactylosporangium thailandense]
MVFSGAWASTPGGGAVDEQAGDAGRAPLGLRAAGAREDVVEVGLAGVGDPGLGAAHGPAVRPGRGPGLEGGGVGAAVRLGEAVGAEPLAAEHLGQQLLALLGGAEGGEGVAGEGVHGDALGHGQPAGRELLEDLQVELVGHPGPADLLGVGQAEQPGPAEDLEQLAGEAALRLELVDARRQLAVGDLPDEPDERRALVRQERPVHGHAGTSASLRRRHDEALRLW